MKVRGATVGGCKANHSYTITNSSDSNAGLLPKLPTNCRPNLIRTAWMPARTFCAADGSQMSPFKCLAIG